jgi:hypothetical protein
MLLTLASFVSAAPAQSPLVDWAGLPASEFAAAAAAYFERADRISEDSGSQYAPDETRAVVQLAWSRFLDDAEFLASGDWQTVAKLASLFAGKSNWLGDSAAGGPSERLAVFRAAVSARIASEPLAAESIESLEAVDGALEIAGVSRSELAPRAVRWMETHDWQSLNLSQRVRLANLLHVERAPVDKLSVRWTGLLTPAAAGDYVFQQLRQHHIDGTLRVSLGGRIVLDSASHAKPTDDGSGRVEVVGDSVALAAGESVPIIVEYQYDSESMVQNHELAERIFPMAVLLWQRGDGKAEIVPSAAFSTAAGEEGLNAEYFAGADFGNTVLTRVDPGVQMIWSGWQIASEFADEQAAVTENCLESILNGRISDIPDVASFLEYDLPRLLKRLPAKDRMAITQLLTSDTEGLRVTSCDCCRQILRHMFMLPEAAVADYLTAWTDVRDVERSRPLSYPGWGEGSYLNHCYDDYGWIAHYIRGAKSSIAQTLIDESLERADGSCNLMIAYCVAHAEVIDRRSEIVREALESRLKGDALTGDSRATWLLARAFYEEVNAGGIPRPQLGMPYLEEASLVAESDEMQFRIAQEMAARYGALGQVDAAASILNRAASQHPEHAEEISQWRAQTESLAERYRSASVE